MYKVFYFHFFPSKTITSLLRGDSRYATFSSVQMNGSFTIVGIIDPDDLIVERNERDNMLFANVTFLQGCTDSSAENFNPDATWGSSDLCEYPIYGCMDPSAVNFVLDADMEDNSCKYGPTAVAGKNVTVIEGEIVQFSGAGVDSDGIVVKYEWDFDGDGIFEWSSEENGIATFFYNDGGEYITTLRVTDDEGNAAVDDRTIVVIADPNEGPQGEDDGELSSISLLTSLILVGLLAIFRRR